MAKYVCSVCGYVYDEEKEGVSFSALPDNWVCPLCGAKKNVFALQGEVKKATSVKKSVLPEPEAEVDGELSNGELSILCGNLAKGCEKQYMAEEAALFSELADYYAARSVVIGEADYNEAARLLNDDLTYGYVRAFSAARADGDRGAIRALTWSEKVGKILNALLERYTKEGTAFLEGAKIFVCEICGFVYIGDEAPDVCPICKVPKFKMHEVRRS